MAPILTLAEACEYMRVSRATMVKWINEGKIPALQLDRRYRIRKSDLDALFGDAS